MTYFETDYITVAWNEELKAVQVAWRGYYGGGQGKAQTGCAKITELLTQKRASKLLSDMRESRVADQADQKWFLEVWLPQIVKAGLRYSASITPKSAVGRLSFNSTVNRIESEELHSAYFEDMKEAYNWLKQY